MKGFKKVLSVTLCASMLFGSLTAFAADTAKDIDYRIANPYKDVNWQTVNQYKTALHTHTNASDGDISLRTSIETHVLQGFDLVATTDHGINNKGWASADQSDYKLIHGALELFGRTEGDLDYLGSEGTFEKSGYAYTLGTENGDDYLKVKTDAGERTIMRIPNGIENNAVSINAHVNSWFVDYQDDTVTDYIDAMRGVTKAGGICVINHPGEYTKAKEDLTSEEAYNESNWAYRYYINRFYGMIKKYPACLGIDMNSKGDSRTRYDRELWDILLKRATPGGRNIFAICSSDAHQASVINTGYTRLLMENMNSKEARKALETGAYFGCSYCNGNQKELENISEYITKYYGDTESELLGKVDATVAAMQKRVADVASGEADVDEGPASPMKLIDNDGYFHGEDTFITGIAVDEKEDTITVNTENALLVRWIADGEVIAVTKAAEGTSTIDLDDYSDQIGCYVRAEAFGEGGTVYTNPFVLSYEGQPTEKNYPYFSFPVIDALFAEIRNLITILGRVFGNLFN